MIETRQLVTSDFELRESADGERTIVGLAAPYNEVVTAGDYKEMFARGAFGEFKQIPLFYGHSHATGGEPIGVVTRGEDTEAGYKIEARLSKTSKANDIYELLKDKALSSFSVGFKPIDQRDEDGVVVRTAVDLKELSVVPFPAYSAAKISEVRSDDEEISNERSNMTDTLAADLIAVRESVEDLTRKVDTIDTRGASSTPAIKYNSLGEFVKALSTRSATKEDAELITRAFTGATTADSNARPAWVNKQIRLLQEQRNVLSLFNKNALPSTGNSVEYPKLNSVSGTVGVQANEGDDLPYMEISITDASTPVVTYGGYSSLSRQAIERSDVPYLNKVLEYQLIQYAKVTNGAVRTALTGATGTATATLAASPDGVDYVDLAIDASSDIFDNTGFNADVWVVSRDQFKALAGITDSTGRPVFVVNGDGSNTFGNVSLAGLTANVAGVRVVVDKGLSGANSYVVSSQALTVMESGPFNLNDENIINLTKDFSLYGYMAISVDAPAAIVKVTHATA